QNQVAERLDAVGQRDQGWRYRHNTLALALDLPPEAVGLQIFEEAVRSCLLQRRPRAALDFQSHLIATAERLGLTGEAAAGRLDKVRIEAALGEEAAAKADFGLAIESLARVPRASHAGLAARVEVARRALGEGDERAATLAHEIGSVRTFDSLL